MGGFAQIAQAFSLGKTARDNTATLELHPHPGSIGGCVAGTINLPRSVSVNSECVLNLSCIFSVVSGADDFTDDRLQVLWTHELNVMPRLTRDGAAVAFSFEEIPDGLPESQLPFGGHYVDWVLTLTARDEGTNLRYTFSVPVFLTELYEDGPARLTRNSRTAALLSSWSSQDTWRPYRTEIKSIGDSLVIRSGPRRRGMTQTGGWGGLVAIFLLFLLSLTLLLFANDELVSTVVTGVFGIAGLFVTARATYLWLRIVEVRVRSGWLSYRVFIFGRAIKSRTLAVEEISGLTIHLSQLFLETSKYGAIELIDSVHDLKLLNDLRRLISTFLAPE